MLIPSNSQPPFPAAVKTNRTKLTTIITTHSKDFLQRVMAKDVTFSPELIKSVVPTGQASVRRALRSVGNPVAKLTHLRQLVMVLVKQLSRRSATFPLGTSDRVSAADRELDRGIEADEVCTYPPGANG